MNKKLRTLRKRTFKMSIKCSRDAAQRLWGTGSPIFSQWKCHLSDFKFGSRNRITLFTLEGKYQVERGISSSWTGQKTYVERIMVQLRMKLLHSSNILPLADVQSLASSISAHLTVSHPHNTLGLERNSRSGERVLIRLYYHAIAVKNPRKQNMTFDQLFMTWLTINYFLHGFML